MTARDELRRLAEKATPGALGPAPAKHLSLTVRYLAQADDDYLQACDPATILALLDDVARLEEQIEAERFIHRSCSPDDPTGVRNAARIMGAEKRAEQAESALAALRSSHARLREALDGVRQTLRTAKWATDTERLQWFDELDKRITALAPGAEGAGENDAASGVGDGAAQREQAMTSVAPVALPNDAGDAPVATKAQAATPAPQHPSDLRPAHYPLGEFDASKWADEFMRLWGHRLGEVDNGLMIAWFASAIMSGHDHHAAAHPAPDAQAVVDAAMNVYRRERAYDAAIAARPRTEKGDMERIELEYEQSKDALLAICADYDSEGGAKR